MHSSYLLYPKIRFYKIFLPSATHIHFFLMFWNVLIYFFQYKWNSTDDEFALTFLKARFFIIAKCVALVSLSISWMSWVNCHSSWCAFVKLHRSLMVISISMWSLIFDFRNLFSLFWTLQNNRISKSTLNMIPSSSDVEISSILDKTETFVQPVEEKNLWWSSYATLIYLSSRATAFHRNHCKYNIF